MTFTTVTEAVAYWSTHNPDKICLIDSISKSSITYSELWYEARAFAQRLINEGLKKDDRVVVRVGSLIETYIAIYGIYLAGGIFCPVEGSMKPRKFREMLEYYDSKLYISTEKIDFDRKWINLSTTRDFLCEPINNYVLQNPDDMCAIVFTTGTTGKAKGVIYTHKTMIVGSEIRNEAHDIRENDVYLWANPLDRIGGFRIPCSVFLVGGCAVYFRGSVFIEDLKEALTHFQVTVLHLNAFILRVMLENLNDDLRQFQNQIRIVILAGNFVTDAEKQKMQNLLPKSRMFVSYTATEVNGISYFEFSKYNSKPNCVGKPYRYVKITFINDEGLPLENTSLHNPGIYVCESPATMKGYWKDDELTAKTLKDNRVIMTDIGYLDEDGYYYILGRRDDVIVTGGFKIAPYEVENVVTQFRGVKECACVPLPDKLLGSVAALFVIMHEGTEFSAKEIRNYLTSRLESFKLPQHIIEVDDFPRARHGDAQKINRKELIKQYEKR